MVPFVFVCVKVGYVSISMWGRKFCEVHMKEITEKETDDSGSVIVFLCGCKIWPL